MARRKKHGWMLLAPLAALGAAAFGWMIHSKKAA